MAASEIASLYNVLQLSSALFVLSYILCVHVYGRFLDCMCTQGLVNDKCRPAVLFQFLIFVDDPCRPAGLFQL